MSAGSPWVPRDGSPASCPGCSLAPPPPVWPQRETEPGAGAARRPGDPQRTPPAACASRRTSCPQRAHAVRVCPALPRPSPCRPLGRSSHPWRSPLEGDRGPLAVEEGRAVGEVGVLEQDALPPARPPQRLEALARGVGAVGVPRGRLRLAPGDPVQATHGRFLAGGLRPARVAGARCPRQSGGTTRPVCWEPPLDVTQDAPRWRTRQRPRPGLLTPQGTGEPGWGGRFLAGAPRVRAGCCMGRAGRKPWWPGGGGQRALALSGVGGAP